MLKKIFCIFALIVFAFFQMDELSAATKAEMQDAIRNDVDAKYDAYDKCRGQSCESATKAAYDKAFENYDNAWGGKTTIESAYNNVAGSSSNSANDPTATEVNNNVLAKPEITSGTSTDGNTWNSVSLGQSSIKTNPITGETVTKTLNEDGTESIEYKDADGNISYAQSQPDGSMTGDASAIAASTDSASATEQGGGGGNLKTITSEKVPGAICTCIAEGGNCDTDVTKRKYECTSGKGLEGFQQVFAQIIRYVINITLLLGVLAVAGLGVAWSFAGGDDIKMKSTLKKWAINIIIGLAILFMFSYILTFLAPWVYE